MLVGLVVEDDRRRAVAQQLERTRHNKHRPLLNSGDPAKILADLFAVRDPLYREVADIVVPTDGRTVAAVAEDIRHQLESAAR